MPSESELSLVEVALLARAVPKPLTYALPEALREAVQAGSLVSAPLHGKLTVGVVVSVGAPAPPAPAQPIHSLLVPQPALHPHQLELARWMAQEYGAPLGRCCALMVPPGLTPRSSQVYVPAARPPQASLRRLTEAETQLLDILQLRGALTESQLREAMRRRGIKEWRLALRRLLRNGLIAQEPMAQLTPAHGVRRTLVQLATDPATLDVALAAIAQARGLRTATRARRADLLRFLAEQGGLMWADWLLAETGATREDINWLAKCGYLVLGNATRWRDPLADVDYVPRNAPPLTGDQQAVWEVVSAAIHSRNGQAFLLRGVTGSGKTEIYLRAVEAVVQQGRGALVLVPEISLTPQTARRFLERLPGKVALVHSQLKPGERYDTWQRIRRGDLPVVVGARSALFAPLVNIGLIVLDEEHDSSYKQQSAPFYDARRVALRYAQQLGATLILGSATPSLESWYLATQPGAAPRLRLLELPNRVRSHLHRVSNQAARFGLRSTLEREGEVVVYQPLPKVEVVDMRQELRSGNFSIFSNALARALEEVLWRGEQAILFLNRRGSASVVLCRDCGYVARCPHDDMPLTLHRDSPPGSGNWLRCHLCNHAERPPQHCPACGSARIRYLGIGTQSVESALRERFPAARIVRWDRDTAAHHGADALLKRFTSHQADVLIGTQMIAKGIDLPLVTLVGVILADVGLFLPDFRASERVFALLTQVAGRAGRSLLPGRVIVQTYNPQHPAITFAARHDVHGFIEAELAQRRLLRLPPFTRLVRLECAHEEESQARRLCEQAAAQLRRLLPSDAVIGPA
ncbi:MAG: primosomal protein N', partial [Thermoflexales bacterium]